MTEILGDWGEALKDDYEGTRFWALLSLVRQAYQTERVYPPFDAIFRAFELCPYRDTRVVILGQDPYHDARQADGLAFSVANGQRLPPSLVNIFKEVQSDCGHSPKSGDLSAWAKQGVLLLNTVLTVAEGRAASHTHLGWQAFTDAVIRACNRKSQPIVFMLWGNFAQSKLPLISDPKHRILTASHPSPLSAHHSFFGCGHFKKANEFLGKGMSIDWGGG